MSAYIPSDVLEGKVWGTISHFKQVKVLPEKYGYGKTGNYQIQTHPDRQQEMDNMAEEGCRARTGMVIS